MANEAQILHSGESADMWGELLTSYSLAGLFTIGNNYDEGSSSNRSYRGAIRFRNIPYEGSINYAGLILWTSFNGKDETPRDGGWNFKIWGIDEDNTGSFSSNPIFTRPTTDAYSESNNDNEPDTGTWKEINVTSAVNEVMSRSGFHAGNALGLVVDNNGSGKNKYAADYLDRKTFLVIRKNAEPNFKPSPQSSAVQTFLPAKNYGVKIAKPGYNVFTATSDQLHYTSDLPSLRIFKQGVTNVVSGVWKSVYHGLGHKPCAVAYVKSTGGAGRFKIPRYFPSIQQDPYADNINASVSADANYIYILANANAEVYYYIFLDELT